jgi:hypothetical protein
MLPCAGSDTSDLLGQLRPWTAADALKSLPQRLLYLLERWAKAKSGASTRAAQAYGNLECMVPKLRALVSEHLTAQQQHLAQLKAQRQAAQKAEQERQLHVSNLVSTQQQHKAAIKLVGDVDMERVRLLLDMEMDEGEWQGEDVVEQGSDLDYLGDNIILEQQASHHVSPPHMPSGQPASHDVDMESEASDPPDNGHLSVEEDQPIPSSQRSQQVAPQHQLPVSEPLKDTVMSVLADVQLLVVAKPDDKVLRGMLQELQAVWGQVMAGAESGSGRPLFMFSDGPVVKAAKLGRAVVLEDFDTPSPAVTERLNSALETEPSLTLPEDPAMSQGTLKLAPGFQVFGTVHLPESGGRSLKLSPAARSRFTEIHCAKWVL